VRVIRAEPVAMVPRTLGYGTVRPGRIWQAVSEVRGRVVEVHPQLEAGAMTPQDGNSSPSNGSRWRPNWPSNKPRRAEPGRRRAGR
jgi:hypothetical protein